MRGLLVSLLILCITCTTKAVSYCNDHGNLTCTCKPGYSGTTCETVPDWCTVPLDGQHMNMTFDDICSLHGICNHSDTTGPSCICNDGFTGPLCLQVVPGKQTVSQRCALYSNDNVTELNISVVCPDGERCLSDDLDCAFGGREHCILPLGWCLPTESYVNNINQRIAANTVPRSNLTKGRDEDHIFKDDVALHDACSKNGFPVCECDTGYTGKQCKSEIDFCKQTLEDVKSNPELKDMCGKHGSCKSTADGATCHCDPGYSGTFCETPKPSEAFCGLRCLLHEVNHKSNVQVGCSDQSHRCVSDNLDCAFGRKCENPTGWCVPETEGVDNHGNTLENQDNNRTNLENQDNLMTTLENQDNLMTTLENQDNLMTTAENQDNLMTTAENQDNLMTTLENQDNLMTTAENQDNLMTTAENQDNLMVTLENQDNLMTTAENQDNPITTSENNDNQMTTLENTPPLDDIRKLMTTVAQPQSLSDGIKQESE